MMAVTLSPSRAMVHSAWMVYMAVPSPISAITGRCGQAMAAPTALGRPLADGAAREGDEVVARAALGHHVQHQARW